MSLEDKQIPIIINTGTHKLTLIIACVAIGLSLINSINGFAINRSNIIKIQDSRREIALNTCLGQNRRHDLAIKGGVSKFLADTLAPKRNCQLLIHKRYG